ELKRGIPSPPRCNPLTLRRLRLECFANFRGELLRIERLRKEEPFLVSTVAGMEGLPHITGDENDPGAWARLVHPIGKPASAHLRQDHVCQEKINLLVPALGNQLPGIIRIRRLEHLIAEAAQDSHRKMPHADVVFEEENRL